MYKNNASKHRGGDLLFPTGKQKNSLVFYKYCHLLFDILIGIPDWNDNGVEFFKEYQSEKQITVSNFYKFKHDGCIVAVLTFHKCSSYNFLQAEYFHFPL